MGNENQVGLEQTLEAFKNLGGEWLKKAENANVSEIFEKGGKIVEELKKKEPLNILVLGQTGVGKSTLINAVFGKTVAKTGVGDPQTRGIIKYNYGNGLCIYDSEGFEVEDHSAKYKIENFIMEQERKEVDDQIHIAWICIHEGSNRTQDIEKNFYKLLKEFKIPTIICLTQAGVGSSKDSDGKEFSEVVKERLEIKDERDCIRIRAKSFELKNEDEDEPYIMKPMGLKKLLERSYDLLPESKVNALKKKQNYDKETKRNTMREEASSKATYYAGGAAAVCASPIPFSDIALILPTQIAMIGHISKIYDLGLNEQSIKKIAVALAGVCAAGFAIRATIGNLIKLIPGLGSIAGGLINGGVAFGATKAMGTLYIEYLDSNFDDVYEGRGDDLSFDLKNFRSEKEVEEIIKKASSEYDKKN